MFRLLLYFGIIVIGILNINERDNYCKKGANKCDNEKKSYVKYDQGSYEEYQKKSYEEYQQESYKKYEKKFNEEYNKEPNEECENKSEEENKECGIIIIGALDANENKRDDYHDKYMNECYIEGDPCVKYDKKFDKKYEEEFNGMYEEEFYEENEEESNEKYEEESYEENKESNEKYEKECYEENEEEYEKASCEKCEKESGEYKLTDLFDYFSKTSLLNIIINSSIDPCKNFYEYTCNIWDFSHSVMPSTKNYHQYRIYYRVNKLLKKESKYDQLPFIKMAKQLYQSCIDEDSLEKRGLKPMQQMLNAIGGWPILMSDKEWNAKNYTWQQVDNEYFKLYSFSILFDISYQTDYENDGILMIRPFPQNPLGKKLKIDIQQWPYDMKTVMQLMSNKTKKCPKYMKTIMKVVRAFAKDKRVKISEKKLRINVAELIKFEINLENIIGHKKKMHETIPTNGDKMTIAQLQEYYDLAGPRLEKKINWLHTIQIAFTKLFKKNISDSQTVLVFHKEIFDELVDLLDITPQHVIVNYLHWHVVRMFMSNLNKEMKKIELQHYYSHDINSSNMKIYKEIKLKQRWLKCIEEFQMKDALLYLYVKTYISANNTRAVSIFEEIKNEMIDYMKYSMKQNKLTKLMIEKMDNISLHIDYSEWYDNQTVVQIYKKLKINNNYFTNVLAIIKNENILRSRNFRESKHREENLYRWSLDFLSGNPNYDERSNVINLPALMMYYPYFLPDAAMAANYGVIGSIIGQLLVRSVNFFVESYFDDYDNLTLKTEIRQAFEEESSCLIKQNHTFIPDLVINKNPEYIKLYENLVQDEIVAHFIGIQASSAAFKKRKTISLPQLERIYRNYKITAEDTDTQPKYPKVKFTQEQLFFIFNTLLICGTINPYENFINITNVKVQVTDNLAKMKTFSETFNCSDQYVNEQSNES